MKVNPSIDPNVGKPTAEELQKSPTEDTTSTSNEDSPFGIERLPWEILSKDDPSKILKFNVNPSTVEYNLSGRASISKIKGGRVVNRLRSSPTLGYFDMDIVFTMQSGNLLTPDKSISKGQEVLFRILEILNSDLYTTSNQLNLQTLTINSLLFGTWVLTGLLDISNGITFNEAAESPFKTEYPLVFHVFRSSADITSSNSLRDALLKP